MMTAPQIKTGPWSAKFPDDHLRIGISRSQPRRMAAGYRVYRKLAPGPWFNSVRVDEYNHLFRTEILGALNPRAVAAELIEMAGGRIPVLLCFEWPGKGQWCHRAMVAEWLAEVTGRVVPEFGFETLPQHEHPLMPPSLRRPIAVAETADITPYIGRSATIDGEIHHVVGEDPEQRGRAIIAAGNRQFSTSIETLRRHFD
jgi:uncharacterized protein DUF488